MYEASFDLRVLSTSVLESAEEENVYWKSPPSIRPAYFLTFAMAFAGESAVYEYMMLEVSKLLYLLEPAAEATLEGTVS